MVLPEDINNNMNMGIKRSNESNSNESKKVCCDNKDNDIKMEEAESQNTIECQPQNEPVTTGGCKKQGGCCKKQGGGCPGKQGGGCGGCCKRRAAMMAAAAASDNAENQSEVKPEGQSSPCGGCPRKQSGGGCPGRQGGGCCKKQGGCSGCPGKQGGCCRNQGGSPCANCPGKQGGCCRSQGGSPCANCPNRNFCPSASANAGCPGKYIPELLLYIYILFMVIIIIFF